MGYLTTEKKKVTVKTFVEMKRDGNKIAMLTAYDYTCLLYTSPSPRDA